MSASVAVKGAGANSSILKNSGKSVVQTAAGTGVLNNSSGGMAPGITTTLPAVAGTGLAHSVPNGKTEARTVFGHTAIRNLSHVFVKKEFYNENEYEPTQTVFLPKKFKRLEPVNEKIELLKEQTGNMDTALEDMKKNREEAKKQLEARRIANVREFVVNEGKRINGTLIAFQNKYETQLSDLDKKHTIAHEDFVRDTTQKFDKVDKEHARLQGEIDKERTERIKQNEESFNRILGRVEEAQKLIDDETRERKAGDTQLNQKIDDMDFDLTEKLNKEVSDRNNQVKQLQQEVREQAEKQKEFVNDLRDKVDDI